MSTPAQTPAQTPTRSRGMRDLGPDEMARFRRVEDAFRAVVGSWGYREIRTPTIERLHLFTGAGALSPQMLQRVYSFLDWDGWSGERVVLRPDATIPAARLYLEQYAVGEDARLAYAQNVFRFAGGDESREDWQCGVERIGAAAPQADLELVLLGLAVLRRLGLPDLKARLSHTGVVRAILGRAGLNGDEQLAHYDRILDGDLSGLSEIEARLPHLAAPLRLLFETEGDRQYLANLRAAFVGAVPEVTAPLDDLAVVAEALDMQRQPYGLSMALARNFEYYSGIVFRFEAAGRPVGAGGRYDGLLRLIGESDVPASGLALEVEQIVGLLPASPEAERAFMVRAARPEPALLMRAHEVAEALRERQLVAALDGGSVVGAEVLVEGPNRLRLRFRSAESVYETPAALAEAAARQAGGDRP